MPDKLIEQLEATRADYEKERRWHKLLLDAYSGGGGFQGAIQQPTSSYWGPAAEIYSGAYYNERERIANTESYLDRLPRENSEKYLGRVNSSYYPNHIQGITDLKLAFLHSKQILVEGRPQALADWRIDVNGRGQSYDAASASVDKKAAILGWCPVLFDMPSMPTGPDGKPRDLNRAQARELGIQPKMVPLFPSNLTDFQISSEGEFEWCKIRTDYTIRPSPFDSPLCVSRYTVWYPDRFQVFEVIHSNERSKSVTNRTESSHAFGRVPIAILRYESCPDDNVRGIPMHGQESLASRSMYSRTSELDEHMMKQQAAALVFATNNPEQVGELVIGAENALTIPLDATQQHYWLAPPSSVSEAYRARLDSMTSEIHRMAGVEFLINSQVPLSGISRRYQFMQLNTDIVGFGQQRAKFEQDADRIVGVMLGVDEGELKQTRYIAPTNYDVEDIAEQIKNSSDLLALGLGATADRQVKMRVVDRAIPNLPNDVKAQITDELEASAEAELSNNQVGQELQDFSSTPDEANA